MSASDISTRPARPDDAALLTDLTIRSKAHWGYDEAFMAAARPELTVDPDTIDDGYVVLEIDGQLVGFYNLRRRDGHAWLEDLFIDPEWIGHGLGRFAWEHLTDRTRGMGLVAVRLASDPNAEPFYRAMGAVRVGEVVAGSTGRSLPLLHFALPIGHAEKPPQGPARQV